MNCHIHIELFKMPGRIGMPKLPKHKLSSNEDKMKKLALALDKAIDLNDYDSNM